MPGASPASGRKEVAHCDGVGSGRRSEGSRVQCELRSRRVRRSEGSRPP
jgi:hypothetical protein